MKWEGAWGDDEVLYLGLGSGYQHIHMGTKAPNCTLKREAL
jgi:hypothetical protein